MRKHIVSCMIVVILSIIVSCKKTDLEKVVTEIQTEEKKKVDYDLSIMNYNMFSAFTYEIMCDTEKYINRRMKIKGNFDSSIYEGKRYFSVLIWDPTGCCPTGMDFLPPESMTYPTDFPEKDNIITVIGVLKYTEIEGEKYLTFNAEEVSWDK